MGKGSALTQQCEAFNNLRHDCTTTTTTTTSTADSCTRLQVSVKQFIMPATAAQVDLDIWTAHCAWKANQQQDAKTKEFAIVPLYTADRQGVTSLFEFELASGESIKFTCPSGTVVFMSELTDSWYGRDYPMHGATAGRDTSAVLVGSLRTTDPEVAISTLCDCYNGDWTTDFDVALQQALLCMVGPKTLEYCVCLRYFPIGLAADGPGMVRPYFPANVPCP